MHSHFRVLEIPSVSEIPDATLLEVQSYPILETVDLSRGNPKMLNVVVKNLNKRSIRQIKALAKERAKERRAKRRKKVPPPLKLKTSSPILSVEEGMRKLHGEAPSEKSKTSEKEIKIKEQKKKEAVSQKPKAATGQVPQCHSPTTTSLFKIPALPARVKANYLEKRRKADLDAAKSHERYRTESSCKTSRSEFVRKVLPAKPNEQKVLGYNFLYRGGQLQPRPRQEDQVKKTMVTSKATSSSIKSGSISGQRESATPVSKISTICRTGSSSLPSPTEARRLKLENEELNRRIKKLEENRTRNDLSVPTEAQRMTLEIAEQKRRIKVLEEKLAKPKGSSVPNSVADRMIYLCLRCQSKFQTRSSFDLHLAVEHYLDHLAPETMFPGPTKYCLFVRCNATFDNRTALVVHMQKQHDVINNYLGTVCGENDILREL